MKRNVVAMCLLSLGLMSAAAATAGDGLTEVVGITGNQAPGGGSFQAFGIPVLNNRGEVAVTATLFGGDERLVFGGVGELIEIARLGDVAIDQTAPIDGFGQFGGSVSLSDAGDVAFLGSVAQSSGTTDAILVSRNPLFGSRELEELARVALDGDNNPLVELDGPNVNSRGDVVFRAEDQVFGSRVFLAERFRDLAGFFRTGASPVGDNNGEFDDFARPALNNASELVVVAGLRNTDNGGFDDAAIERLARNAGGFINQRTIIREPANVSGVDNVSIDQRRSPVLNNRGQIAFDGSADFSSAVMRIDIDGGGDLVTGANLRTIAQFDDAVPGGDGRFSQPLARAISDSGDVAFTSSIFANSGGFDEDFGVFVGNGFRTTEIMREGDPVPDGRGEFDGAVLSADMAAGGQVAFSTFLRETGESFDLGNGVNIEGLGLFIGDGEETITVASLGEELLGSTISALRILQDKDLGGRRLINDSGQVAFGAVLADGSDGTFLFTPELHYRADRDGDWDLAGNWTLGLLPGQAHDVVIDSASSATVFGPSENSTVRSLSIGGGAGQVELRLDEGSTITPLSGEVIVQRNGRLGGDGVLDARLVNRGTIAPENVVVEGELLNLGRINLLGDLGRGALSRIAATGSIENRGVIFGGGLVDAAILNRPAAEIRISEGQKLIVGLEGSANEGRIEIVGGELENAGFMLNLPGGSIVARDATLRFDESLGNQGDFLVNFGDNTDFIGALVNSATGRVLVAGGANASLFGVVQNDGVIQVDAGSSVVFFDDVSGAGIIDGGGDVSFDAAFSPGNSPAEVLIGSNVFFRASSILEIEIAGAILGSEFDRLVIEGAATLAGALEVSLLGGFVPSAGDEFEILVAANGVQGSFDQLLLPDRLVLRESANSLTLVAIPEPTSVVLFATGILLLMRGRQSESGRDLRPGRVGCRSRPFQS